MPVTCDGLDLVGADESTSATEAQVDVTSPPGESPDENIIVSLTSQETASLAGRATALRLAQRADYSGDPVTALSDWVQRFVSLIQDQDTTWPLADDERGRSTDVAIETLSWTRSAGAPLDVRWSLEARRGEGVGATGSRAPTTTTPQATTSLGGTDLETVREKRTELTTELSTTPLAYADESETVLVPQSGVVRRITLTGFVSGSPSALRSFGDTMRSYLGTDATVRYQTAFPGTAHDVLVANYSDTHNAGDPARLEYSAELLEGVTF